MDYQKARKVSLIVRKIDSLERTMTDAMLLRASTSFKLVDANDEAYSIPLFKTKAVEELINSVIENCKKEAEKYKTHLAEEE